MNRLVQTRLLKDPAVLLSLVLILISARSNIVRIGGLALQKENVDC